MQLKYVVVFVICFFSQPLFAVEFKQVDYIKDLQNNELYKQYDPKTGRFKNTDSAIVPKEKIELTIKRLEEEKLKLEEEKNRVSLSELISSIGKEDVDWHSLANIEREIKNIKSKIEEQKKFLEIDGTPNHQTIYNVISTLKNKIFSNYNESDTIYVNRFPRYTRNLPKVEIDNFTEGYYHFLKTNSVKSFNKYANKASYISAMFPVVSQTVLYTRTSK